MIDWLKQRWHTYRIGLICELVRWLRLPVYTMAPGYNCLALKRVFLRRLVHHLQNSTDYTALAYVEGDHAQWLCIGLNPAALWDEHCALARWHRANLLLPSGDHEAVHELDESMREQHAYFESHHGIRLLPFTINGRESNPRKAQR